MRRFFEWVRRSIWGDISVDVWKKSQAVVAAKVIAAFDKRGQELPRLWELLPFEHRHRCSAGGDLHGLASKFNKGTTCQWCGGPERCLDHEGWPT